MPHASASTCWPPSDVTQSAYSSASEPLARIALGELLKRELDAGRGLRVHDRHDLRVGVRGERLHDPLDAARSGRGRPSAPRRRRRRGGRSRSAGSRRSPTWQLSTLSPGSTRFRNPASIAEVPEDDRQIVRPCAGAPQSLQPLDRDRAGCPRSRGRGGRSSAAASPRARPGWTFDGPGAAQQAVARIERRERSHQVSHGSSFPSCPGRSAGRDEGPEHRARVAAGGSPGA